MFRKRGMTTIKVNDITNVAGTGAPNFSDGIKYDGAALSTLNTYEYTSSATEPSNPSNGALWWDSTNSQAKIYVNNSWKTVTLAGVNPFISDIAWGGDRGVFGTGSNTINGTLLDTQDYITISTVGNATDFGDAYEARQDYSAVSSSTRGLFVAGRSGSVGTTGSNTNSIEYITFATLDSAADFGDFVGSWDKYQAGASNGTRGVFYGGYDGTNDAPDYGARIEIRYITIGTLGNAADFGDMSTYRRFANAVADSTRSVVAGGETRTGGQQWATDSIEYVTIATTGNATSFGTLNTSGMSTSRGSSDTTRGMFIGGRGPSSSDDEIEYITIQTTGNSTDFGDLAVGDRIYNGVTSNGVRSVIGGGSGPSDTTLNTMEYITIQTTGNGTDFGDLTVARTRGVKACSGNPS